METLLLGYKRIADSAVNSIFCGAKLMIASLLRYEEGIKLEDEVEDGKIKETSAATPVVTETPSKKEKKD